MTPSIVQSGTASNLPSWLDLLACPTCRGPLRTGEDKTHLGCEACSHQLPVIDGIVRCLRLRADQREDEIKQREVEARDQAAKDDQSDSTALLDRLEVPPCLDAMQLAATDVVAELGCGTGRLTLQYLGRVRRVVAVDFSLESLLVLQKQIPPAFRDQVLLLQADITSLPLAPHAFSKVASFQVIEHLPTPEVRQRAIDSAASLLQPGGSFTFTVYHWSLAKRRDAANDIGDYTRKEGYHLSGIYYYSFDEDEVRQLLRKAGLEVDLVKGLIIGIRGGSLLGPLVPVVNRWLSGTRFGIRRAHLLLARGRAHQR